MTVPCRTQSLTPGSSARWRWLGYENSWVDIQGRRVQSVSGGSRWGGGLWIGSRDLARFGLLFLREGNWQGRQIVSRQWIEQAVTPCPIRKNYGYLWWLNRAEKPEWPGAPADTYAAVGNGSNTMWIVPSLDLVVVLRWHKGREGAEFLKRVVAAIRA